MARFKLPLLIALVFGLLSHWVVIETDLFMFVRQGREILKNGALPTQELWSNTVPGTPYAAYQYLSSILFAVTARLARDYAALSTLRAAVVFIGFAGLGRLAFARASKASLAAYLALAPVAFVIAHERFFLRPELLAFSLCLVPLVLVWELEGLKLARKVGVSLGLLVLWSNLHGGTAPFGILIFAGFLAYEPTRAWGWDKKLGAMALGALTWLATPIGAGVIAPTLQNSMKADWSIMRNFDHLPLLPEHFEIGVHGFTYWLLLPFLAAGLVVTYRGSVSKRAPLARRQRDRIVFLLGLVLSVLTVTRTRARIFPLVLFVAPLAHALSEWAGRSRRQEKIAWGLAAVLWLGPLAYQVHYILPRFGFGAWGDRVPVATARFLRESRPAPELLNELDFGGYLGDRVGDLYRVSSDGRSLPFLGFLKEQAEADKAGEYARFLERYHFKTAVLYWPELAFFKGFGFVDSHATRFPPKDWALVFIDVPAMVFAKRVPANQAVIAAHEYKWLRNKPPNYGADEPGLKAEQRAQFEAELDRCVAECPRCPTCLAGKAAFLKSRGDAASGLAYLRRARDVLPFDAELRRLESEFEAAARMPTR